MIDKGITYENIPQLVKPRKDGKRPGYRGDAAYRSGSEQSKTSAGGQGNVGSTESFGGGQGTDSSGKSEGAAGADYSAVVSGPYIDNKEKIEEFKAYRPPVNIPNFGLSGIFLNLFNKGVNSPLQALSDFGASKNRPFFEDVIRAGKLEGVNFGTVSDMSPAQLEQAYQNYMSQRLSGDIDAYGNRLMTNDRDSAVQPITPITGMAAPIESGIASINTPYTFEDYINSFQFYA